MYINYIQCTLSWVWISVVFAKPRDNFKVRLPEYASGTQNELMLDRKLELCKRINKELFTTTTKSAIDFVSLAASFISKKKIVFTSIIFEIWDHSENTLQSSNFADKHIQSLDSLYLLMNGKKFLKIWKKKTFF